MQSGFVFLFLCFTNKLYRVDDICEPVLIQVGAKSPLHSVFSMNITVPSNILYCTVTLTFEKTKGRALDRAHNSRQPFDRLLHFLNTVTLTFDLLT